MRIGNMNLHPSVIPFLLVTLGLLVLTGSFVAWRILTFSPSLPTRSPLAQAVWDGDTEKVGNLLNAGADVNSSMDISYKIGAGGTIASSFEVSISGKIAPQAGMPVLCSAAMFGHSEILRLLLEKGADANRKDKYGQTPLILAAWQGDADSVKLLLSKRADTAVRDQSGRTALVWAQTEQQSASIDVLKKAGAKE